MVETAPLQRVMDFAGAVGGDDDNRRLFGLDRAKLRNCDLKVGQHFQQERLERLIRAVKFVDQEHGRSARLAAQRLQHRAADQVLFGEHTAFQRLAVLDARGFSHADFDHLRRIVPFINGGGNVQPFIALQPDQRASQRLAKTLAISVLPTPASPSRNSGRFIFSARNSTVASARLAT